MSEHLAAGMLSHQPTLHSFLYTKKGIELGTCIGYQAPNKITIKEQITTSFDSGAPRSSEECYGILQVGPVRGLLYK